MMSGVKISATSVSLNVDNKQILNTTIGLPVVSR